MTEFNSIKMIASDMDGTLLNQNREISNENVTAIKSAQAKGIIFVTATGRSYNEALRPLQKAGITCPIICANGAEIRTENGEVISSNPLMYATYELLSKLLSGLDLYFELYTNRGTYTDNPERAVSVIVDVLKSSDPDQNERRALEKAEQRLTNGQVILTDNYQDILAEKGTEIHKLLVFSMDDHKLEIAKNELLSIRELAVSSSADHNIEITAASAQKGLALQKFAQQRGISMQNVMAIGDNYNDLSMLKMAGVGVAMGNAEEEIKNSCRFVTKTNEEHGVAHAIQTFRFDASQAGDSQL